MMPFRNGARVQFRPNLGPPKSFLFTLIRITRFFWDLRLTLIDIPKDVGL